MYLSKRLIKRVVDMNHYNVLKMKRIFKITSL